MSGGKGGNTTTEVAIPEWLESAARQNIGRANEIAQIGYVPYYGPDVAAMTPMQMSAGGNINAAANAFGLGAPTSAGAGMPTAMDYGGMGAYSSAPLYEQSLSQLEMRAPGQYAAMRAPFIDPITGAPPAAPFGSGQMYSEPVLPPVQNFGSDQSYNQGSRNMSDNGSSAGGVNVFNTRQGPNLNGQAGYGAGGYTGIRDVFDGGGAGNSRSIGIGSDLSRSLTDPTYDPPGNVITRALGTVRPEARSGDSMGGGK